MSKKQPTLLTPPPPQDVPDLGMLGVGLVHEIASPLTAALLHMESLRCDIEAIEQSIRSTQNYIGAKQTLRWFSPELQAKKTITQLKLQAPELQARLDCPAGIKLHGSTYKFRMILANIIMNSVESYSSESTKKVEIKIRPTNSGLVMTIRDYGQGFSGKPQTYGLGLTVTRNFVISDFKGSLLHKRPIGKFRKGTICITTLNNY